MVTGKAYVIRLVMWLVLVVLVVSMVTPASAQSSAEKNWVIGRSTGRPLASGLTTYLANTTIGKCLVYQQRPVGINLGWYSPCWENITFALPTGNGQFIRYGNRVAIRVEGGGYLRYQTRPLGINLGWSSTPVYEWEIRGGATGALVEMGIRVALYNAVERDYVIYCVRPFGINLRWSKDC